MNIYIEILHLQYKNKRFLYFNINSLIRMFFRRNIENDIEFIKHYITSEVMEMKKIQLIFKDKVRRG
ncbi:hypothetical protein CN450_21255 [Bacillus cereus]|nr:hypothetical protein CN450_21255 [Bacillus cereus]